MIKNAITFGKTVISKDGMVSTLVKDLNGNRYLARFKEGKFLDGIIQSPWQTYREGMSGQFCTRVRVGNDGNPINAMMVRLNTFDPSHVYKGPDFSGVMKHCRMQDFKRVFSKETQEVVAKAENPIKNTGMPTTFSITPHSTEPLTGYPKMPKVPQNTHQEYELRYPDYECQYLV